MTEATTRADCFFTPCLLLSAQSVTIGASNTKMSTTEGEMRMTMLDIMLAGGVLLLVVLIVARKKR